MERPTQNGPFDSTTEGQCGDLGQLEHSLGKKGRKIQVWMKMMEIDTGVKMDPAKTIGTITARNYNKILMCAHSGYSAGPGREDQCLDTAKWNHLALHHMAKQIDFKFPGNIRDTSGHGQILDEHRGRAHAGHVEVLLACWFVIELLRKEASYVDKPEVYLISQLKRLKELKLGDRRLAFITIDSEPCRVCLQFLNKLSQYTDVVFMVIGSRGLGPVQVRIDGQRRQDMISDVFPDSGDELPDAEPSPSLAEAVEMARPDIPTPDPVVPTTPTPRLNLRPATSWARKPTPWVPDDPEELISSYKKKTPVFEFDGYDRVEGDGHWEIISPGSRVRAVGSRQAPVPSMEEGTGIIDSVMEHDYLSEWEDLGDGLRE
ncbi:hypothetical protein NUW58_g6123 [Xylaria curta]|uniref:Uncharacterized protein n=1 Tax=Xylaria curta TaxID=42375 RepID=A0ACC1NXV9_9PEZI|nr:hypothetical protein NUW58_g6123 [Xylaria curta]